MGMGKVGRWTARSGARDRTGLPSTPWALVLACHPEPTVAVTALSLALAASTGRPPRGVVVAGAAVLAGQCSVGWHNDWLDAARDRRAARADKPVATGAVARSIVGAAAATAVVVCVPVSFLSGWWAGSAHLLAVALAWGYNAGLKATVLSWLPYAVSFPLLVAFVTLGLPGSPVPPWWALLAAALLGTGAHLANAAPDLDDDVAAGVLGLPQRLGYRRSVGASAGLLGAASVVLAFGPGSLGPSAIGLPVALGVVAAGVLAGRRRGGTRVLFRASLVVALVDAAMLVARGRLL